MSEITNTSKDAPVVKLVTAMPGGIEAQERRGQQELVASTSLPTEVHGREWFEAQGVVFGDVLPGDNLFCNATLPAGWKKVATDHDMWSDLVDAEGNKVGAIFYKAASYDRSAFMRRT